MPATYSSEFFHGQRDGSFGSAAVVAPLIVALLRPRSVVDVGCGVGTWLRAFGEQGVADYLGIDGSYVDMADLQIPAERFRPMDLQAPEPLGRTFDLVMSLEVAEHLPPESARPFVSYLTDLGDIVLFSAAIPFQRGTHHVNEQWQSYWCGLFAERGYDCSDVIRPRIWTDERVEYWYRQNAFLFVRAGRLETDAELARALACRLPMISVVHPEKYLRCIRQMEEQGTLAGASGLLKGAVLGKLGQLRRQLRRRFNRQPPA